MFMATLKISTILIKTNITGDVINKLVLTVTTILDTEKHFLYCQNNKNNHAPEASKPKIAK